MQQYYIYSSCNKIKHIEYTSLKPQSYIISHMFSNHETKMLGALRSRTVPKIKDNFHNYYKQNLKCDLCNTEIDSQEHCLVCPEIISKLSNLNSQIK